VVESKRERGVWTTCDELKILQARDRVAQLRAPSSTVEAEKGKTGVMLSGPMVLSQSIPN